MREWKAMIAEVVVLQLVVAIALLDHWASEEQSP